VITPFSIENPPSQEKPCFFHTEVIIPVSGKTPFINITVLWAEIGFNQYVDERFFSDFFITTNSVVCGLRIPAYH